MSAMDTKYFRSDPANVAADPDGWAPLDEAGEWEYTAIPLLDTSQKLSDGQTPICAQLNYAGCREACRRLGLEMLTADDLEHLHTLATRGQCIELPAFTNTPTAETSLAERVKSDEGNRRNLAKAGYRPGMRVTGFGKEWVAGAPPGRAWLMGWWVPRVEAYGITSRKGPGFIQPRPTPGGQGAHDEISQADDGTNSRGKRRRVRGGRVGEGVAAAGAAIAAGVRELAAMITTPVAPSGGHALPPPPKPSPGGHVLPPVPASKEKPMIEGMTFVQARNYRVANRPASAVRVIVLHTMEAAEKPSTAENVAQWFAGAGAPMASAHFCIDSDSTVQCVRLSDVAFAAPGANNDGIQIEMAARAAQSPADWADEYSTAMLDRVTDVLARLSADFNIPLEYVGVTGLLAGARGVTTHFDVSKAYKKSTHQDPGPHFPMATVLANAMAKRAALP